MSNPYESPSYDSYSPPPQKPTGNMPPGGAVPSPLVQQVRVIAILNAVQGGLELLMGLYYIGMAFFFPAMMMMDPDINNNPNEPPEQFFWIFIIIFGLLGGGVFVSAILRIVAAFKNWNYRGRILGIISFGAGMVTVITCYCAPTAVGMLIYGLIVYLNPSVAHAFEMGESGEPPETIQARFSPYGGGYQQ